jgi:hypothetical protein
MSEDTEYYFKHGTMKLGGYTLEEMRVFVEKGELGLSHQVSTDGGHTWKLGDQFPELFAGDAGSSAAGGAGRTTPAMWRYTRGFMEQDVPVTEPQLQSLVAQGLVTQQDLAWKEGWSESRGNQWLPIGQIPEFATHVPRSPTGGEQVSRKKRRRRSSGALDARASNVMGLSGFICALVGLVLAFIPLLIWALPIDSFYRFVPVSFALLALSIVGLVLSVIGMRFRPRAFATAGLIQGIVGACVGMLTCTGWLLTPDPPSNWLEKAFQSTAADMRLAEKVYRDELRRYREADSSDDAAERVGELTNRLLSLVRAYGKHMVVAAKLSRFRQAFLGLEDLRTDYSDFREAIKVKDSMAPAEAFGAADESPDQLWFLLEMFNLYLDKKITLETAQARFGES